MFPCSSPMQLILFQWTKNSVFLCRARRRVGRSPTFVERAMVLSPPSARTSMSCSPCTCAPVAVAVLSFEARINDERSSTLWPRHRSIFPSSFVISSLSLYISLLFFSLSLSCFLFSLSLVLPLLSLFIFSLSLSLSTGSSLSYLFSLFFLYISLCLSLCVHCIVIWMQE